MAVRKQKSWQDIENQKDRILDRLGYSADDRRVYSTDPNWQRAQRVKEIADRYQDNIMATKSDRKGVQRYYDISEKAYEQYDRGNKKKAYQLLDQANQQAIKNGARKYSRRTYMGLSNG